MPSDKLNNKYIEELIEIAKSNYSTTEEELEEILQVLKDNKRNHGDKPNLQLIRAVAKNRNANKKILNEAARLILTNQYETKDAGEALDGIIFHLKTTPETIIAILYQCCCPHGFDKLRNDIPSISFYSIMAGLGKILENPDVPIRILTKAEKIITSILETFGLQHELREHFEELKNQISNRLRKEAKIAEHARKTLFFQKSSSPYLFMLPKDIMVHMSEFLAPIDRPPYSYMFFDNSDNLSTEEWKELEHLKAETIKAIELFKQVGLNLIPAPGDGHCLFNAIGLYVGLDAQQLRNMVADKIEQDPERYREIIAALYPRITVDQFVSIVRETEWADNVEIAVLMRALDRPIYVVGARGNIINEIDITGAGEPIFVYYNGHNHYDGLIRRGKSGCEILEALKELAQKQPSSSSSSSCSSSSSYKQEDTDDDEPKSKKPKYVL